MKPSLNNQLIVQTAVLNAIALDQLIAAINQSWDNGGFTLRLDGTMPVSAEHDWVVSLGDFEQRFTRKPNDSDVVKYLRRFRTKLAAQGRYLGGWKCFRTGFYYLDVSVIVRGLQQALELAIRNRQQSIYNPATGRTFYLTTAAPLPV